MGPREKRHSDELVNMRAAVLRGSQGGGAARPSSLRTLLLPADLVEQSTPQPSLVGFRLAGTSCCPPHLRSHCDFVIRSPGSPCTEPGLAGRKQQLAAGAPRSIYLVTQSAARTDPASRPYCDPKRAEGKHHRPALPGLARRRLNVLWAMLGNSMLHEHIPYDIAAHPADRGAARRCLVTGKEAGAVRSRHLVLRT